MSAEDTNKVAEKNSELLKKKQSAFKSKQAESALYTQDEDKGGWGSKNTFLRRHLDSPNTTKCAFANQSPRFQKSEPLVDKMYDVDTGSGARRTIGLAVAESPRRYGAVFNETKRFSDDKEGCGTSALYNVGENPNTGTLEYRLDKHPRRYTNMKSVVPRGFDPKDIGRNVPDYDFGDGPKHNFAHQLKNTPRKYCMMGSTEARDAPLCRDGTDKPIDPVEPYDTDVVKNISIARSIELTGIEYANMRSKVERFRPPDPDDDHGFGAQDLNTIGKDLKETPRRYHGVGTKTPRFKNPADNQGGQDFYHIDTAHKKSISKGIDEHPVRYKGAIGSNTVRFPKQETGYGAREDGDPDGMNYNTDYQGKASLETQVAKASQKYSLFRSKVPRFQNDSMGKKKGKKLDMDAVYEAELKRVTGVREPAEYYIPNFGTHRGLAENVKRSTRRYAASFQSKTPRFRGEKAREED